MLEAIAMPGDGYALETNGGMLGYEVHKYRYSKTVIKIVLTDGGEEKFFCSTATIECSAFLS